MNDELAIRVVGVGKRFHRAWALHHCSFDLATGSITALVGPNGAGKSTLMAATAGLLALTEGQIAVHGVPVTPAGTPSELGYLAQAKPLYRQHTVATMLEMGRHLNARWDRALAESLCDDAQLDRRAKVRTLSGGQRTRLALALVLARRPSLLLLDEPLADLDPLARREVQQTLLAQATDTGMTVLLSSHILGEIEDACDDLILLTDGRVTLHDSIDEITAGHVLLTGPGDGDGALDELPAEKIVEVRRTARQITVLLAGAAPQMPAGWSEAPPTLEEIVVARLRGAAGTAEAA